MRIVLKKIMAVTLCLVMLTASVIALVPKEISDVSAANYVTGDNSVSSSYKGSIYYKNFSRVPITGDARTDVVAVALSQLGYQEGNSSSDLDGIGMGYNNYTEYNENIWGASVLGTEFYWCASFVSWALLQSGATDHNSSQDMVRYNKGDSEYIWREIACGTWAYQLNRFGYFRYSKYHGGSYIPQGGDLIYYSWSGSGDESDADHIGIVVYSDGSYVYTVEGNTSDAAGLDDNGDGVYFKKYSLGSSYIIGYGVLPYATNPDVPKIDYSGANPTTGLYIADSDKDVHNGADSNTIIAEMPRFTMFEVTEIAANGRLKATYTTSSGTTVTGWIYNNSYRVIQLSSDETNNLDALIKKAQKARYCDYSEYSLADLRSAYDKALAVSKKATATDEEKKSAAKELSRALSATANTAFSVSEGAKYTTTANTRSDSWADDGIRLTDGVKGNADGNKSYYAGWKNTDVEIIVDLGEGLPSNTYRVYGADNSGWGISPASNVTVYVSDDKSEWTSVGSTSSITKGATYGDWICYTMSIVPSSEYKSRFVKFVIAKGERDHLWIEEVEAAYKGSNAEGRVYISGFNTRVSSGQTIIFTPDFGEITVSNANHAFTKNLLATWNDSENCYIVESVTEGTGTDTASIKLSDDQILICAHSWEGESLTNSVAGSEANANLVKNAQVGDKLSFTQLDIEKRTLGAAPTVTIGEYTAPVPEPTRENLALNKKYVAEGLYVNDSGVVSYPDEDGISLTDGNVAPFDAKFNHVAYAGFNKASAFYTENGYMAITVDLEKEYAMDKFVVHAGSDYNSSSGIGAPEQITVLVSADGNDWEEFKTISPEGDSTVSCNAFAIESDTSMTGRYVQFRIVGSRNWMMIAEVEAFEALEGEITPPPADDDDNKDEEDEYIVGDVNDDAAIDSIDYLMIKRYCFNTYDLTETEMKRADIDKNGEVDSLDYVFVKRIAFGSYIVK